MLNGKKTYIVALGTVLTAVGGVLTGTIDMGTAVNMVIQAALAATIRNGIANK